jgi:hypothetical protein
LDHDHFFLPHRGIIRDRLALGVARQHDRCDKRTRNQQKNTSRRRAAVCFLEQGLGLVNPLPSAAFLEDVVIERRPVEQCLFSESDQVTEESQTVTSGLN